VSMGSVRARRRRTREPLTYGHKIRLDFGS
jgi:hypothetical protein